MERHKSSRRDDDAHREARCGVARAFPRSDVPKKRVFGAATALLWQNERGRLQKGPFVSSRKAGKDGQKVATKGTFRDASCIPIKGPARSHEASPGTRRRSRGTPALALRGGRPRSGRSERFPARSRACCCCRPEATRTGAEVGKGGVQSFFARGEIAKSKKTDLFVANPIRSTKRGLRVKGKKRLNKTSASSMSVFSHFWEGCPWPFCSPIIFAPLSAVAWPKDAAI